MCFLEQCHGDVKKTQSSHGLLFSIETFSKRPDHLSIILVDLFHPDDYMELNYDKVTEND